MFTRDARADDVPSPMRASVRHKYRRAVAAVPVAVSATAAQGLQQGTTMLWFVAPDFKSGGLLRRRSSHL
jgi:hypothetical protein